MAVWRRNLSSDRADIGYRAPAPWEIVVCKSYKADRQFVPVTQLPLEYIRECLPLNSRMALVLFNHQYLRMPVDTRHQAHADRSSYSLSYPPLIDRS